MVNKILESKVRQLHEHLVATRERPIERDASRWIGEADAITSYLVGPGLSALAQPVIHDRIQHVSELLLNVETTGDPTADAHVAAARDLAESITD